MAIGMPMYFTRSPDASDIFGSNNDSLPEKIAAVIILAAEGDDYCFPRYSGAPWDKLRIKKWVNCTKDGIFISIEFLFEIGVNTVISQTNMYTYEEITKCDKHVMAMQVEETLLEVENQIRREKYNALPKVSKREISEIPDTYGIW